MSTLALLMSAGTASATTGLPYFHLGALDIGIPIQWFGMIVAAGVLIGATPLRRYAEWHGVSDEHIRGLLTWVMISGFIGAHEFDMLAYNFAKIGDSTIVDPARWWFLPVGLWPSNWPLPLRIWDGISSYGGFVGGSIGFALFVWWKRLPVRLFADITIVGLLPAFSIGRIGCTVVSDHIGAAVDPSSWYAFLAMDYPREAVSELASVHPGVGPILAWNLGLIEFLYLVPVNLVILWLAFRSSKRLPAGYITALTGALYAPVRFFLDFLRPEKTDPRLLGLTFAQWASIVAFGAAIYAASRVLKNGAVAETVAPTSREAQERLRVVLRDDVESKEQEEADRKAAAERKKEEIARARAEREREDAELAAERAKVQVAQPATSVAAADDDEADDEADDAEPEAARSADKTRPTASGARPAAGKPGGSKPGSKPGGGKSSSKSGKSGKSKSRKR
ncbi:MAG TPA: prolipoprotein diacylglyceryl transferase family protein [Kofleriaceae bacterium]|nr:prolipoprotein diacylglyceryl transferase family protein [Kofleriaceae bacterium]